MSKKFVTQHYSAPFYGTGYSWSYYLRKTNAREAKNNKSE